MDFEKLYQQFNDILKEALTNIAPQYMLFEAVGLLDGFMERTYGYELYHQLRDFQEKFGYIQFTIHAEPQKKRTYFFKSILQRLAKENEEHEDDVYKVDCSINQNHFDLKTLRVLRVLRGKLNSKINSRFA